MEATRKSDARRACRTMKNASIPKENRAFTLPLAATVGRDTGGEQRSRPGGVGRLGGHPFWHGGHSICKADQRLEVWMHQRRCWQRLEHQRNERYLYLHSEHVPLCTSQMSLPAGDNPREHSLMYSAEHKLPHLASDAATWSDYVEKGRSPIHRVQQAPCRVLRSRGPSASYVAPAPAPAVSPQIFRAHYDVPEWMARLCN